MNEALKPGALVQHKDGRIGHVGNGEHINFATFNRSGHVVQQTCFLNHDNTLPDGWSLVGDGFAPEGAVLAWVTENWDSVIREIARGSGAIDLRFFATHFARKYVELNPVQSETPGNEA